MKDVDFEERYYLLFTAVKSVDVIKNLGVVFDSELFCFSL